MGDDKRKFNEYVVGLSKELIDKGKIIEAGWESLKTSVLSPETGEEQLADMRMAFFAGAHHLFGTIMSTLDSGAEATKDDLRRLSLINDELESFVEELIAQRKALEARKPPPPPPEPLGDAPIEEAYHEKMEAIARVLDQFLNVNKPRDTGFVLLVFPFEDREGRCNFISNGADRKDIVALFKEMIARFEGQPEITGHA